MSWSHLTIQCVFASISGPAIDLQKMPILEKKILYSDEAHHFDLGGYLNKQFVAKSKRIHWKQRQPKRVNVFEDRIISRRADVFWPPRSCDLIPMDYYLWGVVKYKCYNDKPETIDALKDNNCEAFSETMSNRSSDLNGCLSWPCSSLYDRSNF